MSATEADDIRADLEALFSAIEAGACCARVKEHVLVAGAAEYHEATRTVRCCACGAVYPAIGEPEGVRDDLA